MKKGHLFWIALLALGGWSLLHCNLYLKNSIPLERDNFQYHFGLFEYVANSLRYTHSFPTWLYTQEGGVWLAPHAPGFYLLMPYRFVGYLAACCGVPLWSAYKISLLLIGQGIFLFGLWIACLELFDTPLIALATVLFAVFGWHISLIHQEQILVTVFFIPFIWWSFLQCRRDRSYLILLAALIGMSVNSMYPQMQFGYYLSIGLAALLSRPARRELKQFLSRYRDARGIGYVVTAVFALLLSASPLFYTYFRYHGQLMSPWRGETHAIGEKTYEQYMAEPPKVGDKPSVALAYLIPGFADRAMRSTEDRFTFFVLPGIGLFLILALLLRVRFVVFQFLLLGALSILALGMYGPAPWLLWKVMPGIHIFRQWSHYIAYVNLHLLLLAMFALQSLFQFARKLLGPRSASLAIGLFVGALLSGSLIWASHAVATYEGKIGYYEWAATGLGPYPRTEREFIQSIAFDENYVFRGTRPHVAPTEIDPDAMGDRNQTGLFHWSERGHDLALDWGKDYELNLIPQGFKIALGPNPTADTLDFEQYNDGRWRVRLDGRRVRPLSTALGGLRIALPAGAKEIEIDRAPSPWTVLIWLMWIPLFGFFAWRIGRQWGQRLQLALCRGGLRLPASA